MATRAHWMLCFLLVLGNAALQVFMHGDALNAGVENRAAPSSTDSRDYARRAGLLAEGKFAAALADGYRTPGYPLFLAAFSPFDAPLRLARYTQVILTSAVVLLAFLTLLNLSGPGAGAATRALCGAALIAVWPPLYYFSPLLLAEACSLFALALLLWTLSRRPSRTLLWTVPPLLALLVLLKPNHLLLLLPVALFLRIRKAPRALFCVLLALALLAPWSAFISWNNRAPLLLSTASGVNLYLGTGVVQPPREASTLPYRFALNTGMIRDTSAGYLPSGAYAREARYIWKSHPVRTSLYGLAKVLHGFGFSWRGIRDVMLTLLLAASLVASARVWKRAGRARDETAWTLLFWGVLLVTVFQLFVYLPNQRLKTVLFDYPALLIVAYGLISRPGHPSGPGTGRCKAGPGGPA